MVIREASAEDLDAIVELFRACWNTSYKELLPEQVRTAMDVSAARELWAKAFEPNDERKTLVVDEGGVVGVARIGRDPHESKRGHLFSLYIHPKASGKGFGRALLKAAMAELDKRGFTEKSLWVFRDNEIARSLYTSWGFTPTGVEKIDPRWQIPEIEMVAPTQP